MIVVWDEPKRRTNIEGHDIDFAEIRDSFDFASSDIVATYGDRFKATGTFGDRLVTVVFSLLGAEAISIISARAASRKERTAFDSR